MEEEDARSPIWGGATLGLVVGLILGFFVGSSYWMTVLYAVLIGAGTGVVANLLALPAHIVQKRRERAHPASLESRENVLREHPAAEFEKMPDAEEKALDTVMMVEEQESWRTGYDSLEAFYAAHQEQHPDIRTYAARGRTHFLTVLEAELRATSAADFETNENEALVCLLTVRTVEDGEYWRAGYDSFESFYRAHEALHPDIRVYAAVYRGLEDGTDDDDLTITQVIAEHRASAAR